MKARLLWRHLAGSYWRWFLEHRFPRGTWWAANQLSGSNCVGAVWSWLVPSCKRQVLNIQEFCKLVVKLLVTLYWTWSRCACPRTGSDPGAGRGTKLSIGVIVLPFLVNQLRFLLFGGVGGILFCFVFTGFWRVGEWYVGKLAFQKKVVICSVSQFPWWKCSHPRKKNLSIKTSACSNNYPSSSPRHRPAFAHAAILGKRKDGWAQSSLLKEHYGLSTWDRGKGGP